MDVIAKVSITLAGATGVTGGGILVYKLTNKNTISKNIKPEYLLTKTHASQWTHRIELLKKANDSNLGTKLLALKNKNTTLTTTDLQDWCSNTLQEEFKGEKDSKFLNVRLYCGLNIGDKIEGNKVNNGLQDSDTKLKTNVDKLNGKTETDLGKELFAIIGKTNSGSTWEGNKALKEWCLKTLDLAFEEGRDYENAKVYCVTT